MLASTSANPPRHAQSGTGALPGILLVYNMNDKIICLRPVHVLQPVVQCYRKKLVNVATGAGIAQWYSASIRQEMLIFLFTTTFILALGPTKTPIQWVL